jgi:agmatine/peptidylarginine deiminase
MTSRRFSFSLGVAAFLLATAPLALAQQPVPRNLSEEDRAQMNLMDQVTTPGSGYFWECYPDLAGFTATPPADSRFPGEFENVTGVFWAWPFFGCQIPEITEGIRNSIRNAVTNVIVDSMYYDAARNCLTSRGFTSEDLDQISWYVLPADGRWTPARGLDSIWYRDFGAETLISSTGQVQFVDMVYYESLSSNCLNFGGGSRPNDDSAPTRVSPMFMSGVEVFRPQLRMLGGNLQTDGRGTCIHARRDTLRDNQFSRWFYTQEQLDEVISSYYNCPTVITMDSLVNGVIDHIDMYMTVISPNRVLVGKYDPADDPANAAILDTNAQRLVDAGFTVDRIWMPTPYCSDSGFPAQPGRTRMCTSLSERNRVWATYGNSVRIGSKVLVPVYQDVPAELADEIARREAETLQTYQSALTQEYGKLAPIVTPVVSDAMITGQGSLHCITITY